MLRAAVQSAHIVASRCIRWPQAGHFITSISPLRFMSVGRSTYLAVAKSSPSSKRPPCLTEILVGSTTAEGSVGSSRNIQGCEVGVAPPLPSKTHGSNAGGSTGGTGTGGTGAGSGEGVLAVAAAGHGCGGDAWGGGFGVTNGRHEQLEANTPWSRICGILGWGISAASRAMSSIGAITRCVRPRRGACGET